MTRVALLAEKAGHHPDWSNSWNTGRHLADDPLGRLDRHRQRSQLRRGDRQAARMTESGSPQRRPGRRGRSDLGPDIEPFHFPDGTKTAADAAAAIGVDVGQIVKSLIFAVDGEVCSPTSADATNSTRQACRPPPVSTCTSTPTPCAATGFPIGGVPPSVTPRHCACSSTPTCCGTTSCGRGRHVDRRLRDHARRPRAGQRRDCGRP